MPGNRSDFGWRFLACLMLLLPSAPAHAYLDAGTGSIMFQAIVGAAATGMLFGRAYLARLKSMFRRTPDRQGTGAGQGE